MTAEIRVLSGARAGLVLAIEGRTPVGRAADAALRFDPELDLHVSAHHALLDIDADGWHLRDEGSRNGTFLNGKRVSAARLRDRDRIRFGTEGPEIEIRLPMQSPASRSQPAGATASVRTPSPLARQNVRLRRAVLILGAALLGSLVFALWSINRSRSIRVSERRELLGRIDSVLTAGDATVRALSGERAELAAALRQSRIEIQRLRRALEEVAGDDAAEVDVLRRQLQSAVAALSRQQLAASLDYEAIERAVRRAVAVLWVETGDGMVATGTAFAVRADATLVTTRHVLASQDGEVRPRRVAVQFSDSDQVWPARILGVSDVADLAVLKVDNIAGGVNPAPAFNLRPDTLGPGAPVAWMGFPRGGETWPQDPRTGMLARPLGSVGVITALSPDTVEIQGYGAGGASGSPILDSNGQVLAVLFGRRTTGEDQLLIAVPAALAAALLERIR